MSKRFGRNQKRKLKQELANTLVHLSYAQRRCKLLEQDDFSGQPPSVLKYVSFTAKTSYQHGMIPQNDYKEKLLHLLKVERVESGSLGENTFCAVTVHNAKQYVYINTDIIKHSMNNDDILEAYAYELASELSTGVLNVLKQKERDML